MKNLNQRILEVYKAVKGVEKNAKIRLKNGGYDGVKADDVTEILHEAFAEHGIISTTSYTGTCIPFMDGPPDNQSLWYRAEVNIELTLENADDMSQVKVLKCFSFAEDQSDKATGKAVTLGVKNILLNTFMLSKGLNEEDRLRGSNAPQGQVHAASPPPKAPPVKNYAPQATGKAPSEPPKDDAPWPETEAPQEQGSGPGQYRCAFGKNKGVALVAIGCKEIASQIEWLERMAEKGPLSASQKEFINKGKEYLAQEMKKGVGDEIPF